MSVVYGEEMSNNTAEGELDGPWTYGGRNQSGRLGILEMGGIANGAETSKREHLFPFIHASFSIRRYTG